jgi:hypothetical protein
LTLSLENAMVIQLQELSPRSRGTPREIKTCAIRAMGSLCRRKKIRSAKK